MVLLRWLKIMLQGGGDFLVEARRMLEHEWEHGLELSIGLGVSVA